MPDPSLGTGDGVISLCGWCGKVRVGTDWFELEGGIEQLRLMKPSLSPRLSHGLCGSCLVEIKKDLEAWKPQHKKVCNH